MSAVAEWWKNKLWSRFSSQPWLGERTIFLTKHGSHAYGTTVPSSDLDFKGVAVPPVEYFHGFVHHFEQAESKEPDLVIYDIRKFMRLAADCNPNIIEVLFTSEADHAIRTPLGDRLIANRNAFLSQKAKHTFSGYAVSQLKRIQAHYRWLRNPPKAPPTRAEYDLPERTLIPRDQLQAAESQVRKRIDEWNLDLEILDDATRILVEGKIARYLTDVQVNSGELWNRAARSVGYDENFIHLLDRERQYGTRQREWEQFQNWKATRNADRAALEEKWGYDTKHAMHLVRLLRMCREILTTGQVIVKRPDAAELLAIRNGAWTYERLIAWAESEDILLERAVEASPLPKRPNREALNIVCMEIVELANPL